MGLIQDPIIPDADCTLTTCSLLQAHFQYVPTLAGNALYLAIFALALVAQIFLGIRHKTWGFMAGMFGGLVLEILGYVGRIQMHYNPFTDNPFLMYLVCLTIGPAFLSAAIYLCLARIIVVFGASISRFRPGLYTIVFICCDFLSLLLQAAGGAIASGANTVSQDQMGINIMIAGLSTQVASLTLFITLCGEYAFRVWRNPHNMDPAYISLRQSLKFKVFLFSLALATITIFVRSCFRVAELQGGFHGTLANQEVTFMILEGAMVIVAVLSLTFFHPGVAFRGSWNEANFTLRKNPRARKISGSSLDDGEIAKDSAALDTRQV